jgi:hypothetical protein
MKNRRGDVSPLPDRARTHLDRSFLVAQRLVMAAFHSGLITDKPCDWQVVEGNQPSSVPSCPVSRLVQVNWG